MPATFKAIQVDANTEIGRLTNEGRTYDALGYVRTDKCLVAYLGKDHKLTRWDGEVIGTYRITASWPIRSYISHEMHQVSVTLTDGSRWTGRSTGEGMVFTGRPVARKER